MEIKLAATVSCRQFIDNIYNTVKNKGTVTDTYKRNIMNVYFNL